MTVIMRTNNAGVEANSVEDQPLNDQQETQMTPSTSVTGRISVNASEGISSDEVLDFTPVTHVPLVSTSTSTGESISMIANMDIAKSDTRSLARDSRDLSCDPNVRNTPASSGTKFLEEAGNSESEGVEPDFPIHELNKLDDMINKPRWVIPVLPKGELEVLLEASIDLCKKGYDVRCEPCQRFIRDGLMISFTKILTDEAVSGWKFEIHVSFPLKLISH